MRQVVQDLRTGELSVAETPAPEVSGGTMLVRNAASVISPGTERMVIDMAKSSWLQRARERPDLVRQVVRKLRTDGVVDTWRAVGARLNVPVPLGYSCAGTVIAVGRDVPDVRAGDRVACGGQGVASHAEFVAVPRNLAVAIPGDVPFDHAAFVTLGAIALHGVRVTDAQIGSRVAVFGLGLIGQVTAMILRASGCQVFAFDPNEARASLAGGDGVTAASDPAQFADLVRAGTGGVGADAAIVAAGGGGAGLMDMVAETCRDRAVVTVVGAVKLALSRRSFYEKELQLRMSRGYGPGRYDRSYEERGIDYPIGYVRWTERRNFEEFLRLVDRGLLPVGRLITHRIDIAEAPRAYDILAGASGVPAMGVVLTYPGTATPAPSLPSAAARPSRALSGALPAIGVIGAGTFAQSVLLPRIGARKDIRLAAVAAREVSAAKAVADRYGFGAAASSADALLDREDLDAVFIATRHDSHAAIASAALRRGLRVFLEKPLALDEAGLSEVIEADAGRNLLMVGFNRRFAAPSADLRRAFEGAGSPLVIVYRINAGLLPPDIWIRDPLVGGGRIIGEVCHFIDLCAFLTGSLPSEVSAAAVPAGTADDSVVLTVRFTDGSLATIAYACGGDKGTGKEHIQVIGRGAVATLDDFHELSIARGGRTTRRTFRGRAKGFDEEIGAFVAAVAGSTAMPIPLASSAAITRATFAAMESLRRGVPVAL